MLSRTDANQGEILATLRQLNFKCYDLHRVGEGFPDVLISGYSLIENCVVNVLVEIKTEGGKLNPAQIQWHSEYRNHHERGRLPLIVAQDANDVLEWFGR